MYRTLREGYQHQKIITTIITTCPQPSIPSGILIFKTINSLQMMPTLLNSKIIIGFDGNTIDLTKKKNGLLHKKCTQKYDDELYKKYKENVKEYARKMLFDVEFVELEERSCFAANVKACMEKINTKYVLIVQQDLPFIKSFNVENVINFMERHKADFVKLCADDNEGAVHYPGQYCGIPLAKYEEDQQKGTKFFKNYMYADQTHIANIHWYNNYVWPVMRNYTTSKFGNIASEEDLDKVYGNFMEHIIECNSSNNGWQLGDRKDGWYMKHTQGRTADSEGKLPKDKK